MGKMRCQKIRTIAVEMRTYEKKTPDKWKMEMAKQKAPPDTTKQKLEAKPPVTFRLFVGNLNFNKMATELKTGLSEFFAKNDLAVVGVRVGFSRFGYVNFKSADDQEKALELRDTKVLGYEMKLKKPKGKERKKGFSPGLIPWLLVSHPWSLSLQVTSSDQENLPLPPDWDRDARTLLIKNLPDKVTQHELKEAFEDAFQIRLVSKDGMRERIAYIDFYSQVGCRESLGKEARKRDRWACHSSGPCWREKPRPRR
nr:nucleolin-like isoform X1 [Equus caballus]XP_023498323.1 nucleolin-like isoform X1 [Equus caballus]